MSVVNKMLKDLEARQSQTDEIVTDYHAPQKKQSRLLVLVLLLSSIVAIIFALTNQNQLFGGNKNNEVTAVNIKPLPPAVTKKMMVLPKRIEEQQQRLRPQVESAPPSKANVELVNTTIGIPLTSEVLADDKILPDRQEINSLTSLQNIATGDKQLKIPNSNELDTQVAPEQKSSFNMSGSRQENNTSHLKQRIAQSLNNDNLDLAQSLLSKLLATEPNNIKARKKLASLLFSQGNYAQSKALLTQGIDLHPTQSDLRLMLARLYVVQKEPSKAINILTEVKPSTDNQTEYLAYRASLAQQLKQTILVKSDYKTLTNIEPTNAKWWLGLAIAEDQLGEMNLALQDYKKANSLGQLQGSVKDFIQQRISILAGAQ